MNRDSVLLLLIILLLLSVLRLRVRLAFRQCASPCRFRLARLHSQSAAGAGHSKTCRKFQRLSPARQRLGVRRPYADFDTSARSRFVQLMESLLSLVLMHWDHASLRLTEARSGPRVCDPQQRRFMESPLSVFFRIHWDLEPALSNSCSICYTNVSMQLRAVRRHPAVAKRLGACVVSAAFPR